VRRTSTTVSADLVLYSRPDCHLCDDMKAVIDRVSVHHALTVEIIDISTDPALEAEYGLDIPVLMVDGRRVAKHRITEEALMRAVDAGSL
jgi:hypothetical protein